MHLVDVELKAIDGSNPLGFLAALGALCELSQLDSNVRLAWRYGARWIAFLKCPEFFSESFIAKQLAEKLSGNPVDPAADKVRAETQRHLDDAKTAIRKAEKQLKERKLRGAERRVARERDIAPLERQRDTARKGLLVALKSAVPSSELALGQRPDCTIAEYREHAILGRRSAQLTDRSSIDLLAAFGAEIDEGDDERIRPTPFCFITGSGHQWFLDTARQLVEKVSEDKIRQALFERWIYCDEKLSMRWDPSDDRRYALMDRDPTASDNKSTTVWMANLLAYRALVFFACVPASRGLQIAGWAKDRELDCFTWPLWEMPLTADTIRSLLQSSAFGAADISANRAELQSRGVAVIFRSDRVQVGNPPLHKINFTSSRGI